MMGFLEALLFVIISVIAIIYIFYRRQFQFWKKLGFPHTNPSFPLGDGFDLLRGKTIADVVRNVYKNHLKEPFIGFWLLFRPILLVRDPDLIKTFLVRDFMTFHDRGVYVNEEDDPLAAHLISIGGSKWKNLRVKITPTFTSGKMKMMFPILLECGKRLTRTLDAEKGPVVEMKEFSARFTTDVISLCAFGIETNSLQDPNAEFRSYGQKLFEPTINNIFRVLTTFLTPEVAAILKLRMIDPKVSNFFLKAIKETMDYREANKLRRNDFLDLLIQLKNAGKLDDTELEPSQRSDNTKLTFEQTAAQAFVFFVAGFETSSTTMQFLLYELAKNPEIQQKTRNEIEKVLSQHDGTISYESISNMEYLGRVVDETLRLYPPVPFLQRQSNQDFSIPDTKLTLPKGSQMLIDVFGLHRDPKYFPNPEKFDPERFNEENKSKRHHYVYLPFGEGPRNCIGMRFGLMQTKVGIISLLRNFQFSVTTETPIPLVLDPRSLVLSPKGGMHLKVTKISAK